MKFSISSFLSVLFGYDLDFLLFWGEGSWLSSEGRWKVTGKRLCKVVRTTMGGKTRCYVTEAEVRSSPFQMLNTCVLRAATDLQLGTSRLRLHRISAAILVTFRPIAIFRVISALGKEGRSDRLPKSLLQGFAEELLQQQPRKKMLHAYAEELLQRHPQMRSEVGERLNSLEAQWATAEQQNVSLGASPVEPDLLRQILKGETRKKPFAKAKKVFVKALGLTWFGRKLDFFLA